MRYFSLKHPVKASPNYWNVQRASMKFICNHERSCRRLAPHPHQDGIKNCIATLKSHFSLWAYVQKKGSRLFSVDEKSIFQFFSVYPHLMPDWLITPPNQFAINPKVLPVPLCYLCLSVLWKARKISKEMCVIT